MRRLAGSSAIDAARPTPPVPEIWPRAPRNAPVPPTIAQFARSVEGVPGGGGLPLNPRLTSVPTGVLSLFKISNTCSRSAVRVTSAIAPPGEGAGLNKPPFHWPGPGAESPGAIRRAIVRDVIAGAESMSGREARRARTCAYARVVANLAGRPAGIVPAAPASGDGGTHGHRVRDRLDRLDGVEVPGRRHCGEACATGPPPALARTSPVATSESAPSAGRQSPAEAAARRARDRRAWRRARAALLRVQYRLAAVRDVLASADSLAWKLPAHAGAARRSSTPARRQLGSNFATVGFCWRGPRRPAPSEIVTRFRRQATAEAATVRARLGPARWRRGFRCELRVASLIG
jgi:hypothetical protein